MTPPHLAPPPPSWVPAILAGAVCTVFTGMLVRLASTFGPLSCCCCPLEVLPLGVLPAVLMLRRDPTLTAGQGFAVSFIANGLGSIVVALTDVLTIDAQARTSALAEFRRMLEDVNQRAEQKMTAEQIDDLVSALGTIQPYMPVVFAAIFTVLAGMCGLIAVGVLRRRRGVAPPPPPQFPTLPPSPPPSEPMPPIANG